MATLQEMSRDVREGRPARLYYFYGHDVGALENYVKKLTSRLLPASERAMNLHRFDGGSLNIGEIADACEMLPLFAQRAVITINDLNIDKTPKADADDLRKILSDLPETTTVIIYATGVDLYKNKRSLTDKNKRFCDFCAKNGVVYEFTYKRSDDMAKDIVLDCRAQGCEISRGSARYLAELCLCETSAVDREIEKLTAYAAGREITKADIDLLCIKKIDSDGFALAINILRSNAPLVFKRIRELRDQNFEAYEIVGAISFSLNDLYRARLAVSSGRTQAQCAADFKYPKNREFAVRNAFNECQNISKGRIRNALNIFADTDRILKTRSSGRANDLLLVEEAAARAMAFKKDAPPPPPLADMRGY